MKPTKLRLAILSVIFAGQIHSVNAASCGAGGITIANSPGGCEVDVGTTTTVQFQTGALASDRILQTLSFSLF